MVLISEDISVLNVFEIPSKTLWKQYFRVIVFIIWNNDFLYAVSVVFLGFSRLYSLYSYSALQKFEAIYKWFLDTEIHHILVIHFHIETMES